MQQEKSNNNLSSMYRVIEELDNFKKLGLRETEYIISRPIAHYLNSNDFGNWDNKVKCAIKFIDEDTRFLKR